MNTELIESKIDKEAAGKIAVSKEFGGLHLSEMAHVFEMSKLMAVSQQAVPAHLRANPGMCLAVCLTAIEWRMSPFAVANKTYVTNDRLNYESQLVHAVIEARAPITGRLSVRYEGDSGNRVCIVSGTFKGESEPREHRSPPLNRLMPARNEYGKIKGSPLWDKKPDVQLFYDTSRDWIRIFCPDVLLGIYTPDEVEQYGGEIGAGATDITPIEPVSPGLHDRLKQAANHDADGYRDGVVEDGLKEDIAVVTAAEQKDEKTKRPRKTKPKAEPAVDSTETEIAAIPEQEVIPPTKPVTAPQNSDEYVAHVTAWTSVLVDPDEIERRWASERKMRNNAGVTHAERDLARWIVDDRLAECTKQDGETS